VKGHLEKAPSQIWQNFAKVLKKFAKDQKHFPNFKMKNILSIFERCRKYYSNLRNAEKYAQI
jgi:hypothetical protein